MNQALTGNRIEIGSKADSDVSLELNQIEILKEDKTSLINAEGIGKVKVI